MNYFPAMAIPSAKNDPFLVPSVGTISGYDQPQITIAMNIIIALPLPQVKNHQGMLELPPLVTIGLHSSVIRGQMNSLYDTAQIVFNSCTPIEIVLIVAQ